MMKSMDKGIGRVLQALRDRGLERNTLVIFTSDNGGERYSRNWPFAFQKTFLWEGGIRVPAIARWPGVIPGNRTTNQAAITMDWTATILAATGAKTDPAYPLDGTDLMKVLTGEQAPMERTLFWRNANYDAARMGTWKYLIENTTEHLFDLSKDPGERFDLKEKDRPRSPKFGTHTRIGTSKCCRGRMRHAARAGKQPEERRGRKALAEQPPPEHSVVRLRPVRRVGQVLQLRAEVVERQRGVSRTKRNQTVVSLSSVRRV